MADSKNFLMNLTVNDLLMFSDLQREAKDAQDAYEVIKRKYANAFGLGTKEIMVYEKVETEYSGVGYLTIDGVFKYHDNWWGGRNWEVDVSNPDKIFEVFRLHYLFGLIDVFERNGDEYTVNKIKEMVRGVDETITSVSFAISDWVKQIKE